MMNTEHTTRLSDGTLELTIRLDQRVAEMLRRYTKQMNALARAEPQPEAEWTLEAMAQLLLADVLDTHLHA